MSFLIFIFGVLMGNYGTTLLFRIPRGIEICGVSKKRNTPPHCSECGHNLKFYEYFPILSWIFSRFKCNYCCAKINPQYFFLELSTGITSVIIYKFIGLSETYLLLIALYITTAVSGLIKLNTGKIYRDLTFAVIAIAIAYRTLIDNSIIPFIFDLSVGSVLISFLMSRKIYNKDIIHIILQSSILGLYSLIFVLTLYILCYRKKAKIAYLYSLVFLSYVMVLRNIFYAT
jgi:leader peptidase (prepilin peptidase)/N-methyltransferase